MDFKIEHKFSMLTLSSIVKIIWNAFIKLPKPGSISSTFYKQLLLDQILKAQKDGQVVSLFVLLGSARVKAVHETLMKLTPGVKNTTPVGLIWSIIFW